MSLRVLAVDDEAPALDDLVHLLRADPRIGEIDTARDGAAALRKLDRALAEGRPVAAVFLDIRMPGLDGTVLGRVLAQFARAPQIVYVTAYEEHAVDAFEIKATDYILKPVRPERLAVAIRRVTEAAGEAFGEDGAAPELGRAGGHARRAGRGDAVRRARGGAVRRGAGRLRAAPHAGRQPSGADPARRAERAVERRRVRPGAPQPSRRAGGDHGAAARLGALHGGRGRRRAAGRAPARARAARPARPPGEAVTLSGPDARDVAPGRTLVTGPRTRTVRRPRYPVTREIDEQTGLGEAYMRSLVRAQWRLAARLCLVLAVVVLGLPLLFALVPAVREREVFGLPLPWVLLGGLMYPWFVACGWWYVRQAERNEDDFADLVDRADRP
ncbi:LytR/AlgR family response regulator transcription factor [Actinomadura luteofluorescens]